MPWNFSEEDLPRGRGTREAAPGERLAGAEQAGAHAGGVPAEDHAGQCRRAVVEQPASGAG